LLVDNNCGVGRNWSMNITCTAVKLHLLHKREDDEERGNVEEEIGDRDPILQISPVPDTDNPNVLSTGHDCDQHPGDQEAVVPQLGSEYQQESAAYSKQCIKHCVLDDGSDTDIFALALSFVITSGHLDNIEDCGDHCYSQLCEANDHNRPLERQSKDRAEARLSTTHFQIFSFVLSCDHWLLLRISINESYGKVLKEIQLGKVCC